MQEEICVRCHSQYYCESTLPSRAWWIQPSKLTICVGRNPLCADNLPPSGMPPRRGVDSEGSQRERQLGSPFGTAPAKSRCSGLGYGPIDSAVDQDKVNYVVTPCSLPPTLERIHVPVTVPTHRLLVASFRSQRHRLCLARVICTCSSGSMHELFGILIGIIYSDLSCKASISVPRVGRRRREVRLAGAKNAYRVGDLSSALVALNCTSTVTNVR